MKKLKGNLYKEGETPTNYTDTEYERLEPGAYVCKIVQVRDEEDKEYLYVEYDIAEGPNAGYYSRLQDRANFWGGRIYLSYKDKASNLFGRACKVINNANAPYVFNPFGDGKNADEKTLIGKLFGLVLHEEEYQKNDGSIGSRLNASATGIIDTEKAKTGKFNQKLLDRVPLKNTTSTAPANTPDFMDVDSGTENPFA